MAKGGARARSGPAPDPDALRNDRPSVKGEWTVLPAVGRQGATPEWPLADPTGVVDGREIVVDAVKARELEVWTAEWKRPQAVMWERNRQETEVALYVRALVAAERADASVASRTLVRQQQEALGISIPGLLRNKWQIAQVDVQEGASQAVTQSARSQFKVIAGGDGDD